MAGLDEIREARLSKLKILKERGINPYPAKVPKDIDVEVLKKDFEKIEKGKSQVSIAGRVMALRGQGAILFAVIFDGTGKIQEIVKKDTLSADQFSLFVDTV